MSEEPPARDAGREEPSAVPQSVADPVRWRPVSALRYRRSGDALARVTIAPPDHWDDEQVASFERRDPHNVVRLLAPVLAGDGDPGRSDEVADRLRHWLAEGVLGLDPIDAVYVYRCTEGHAAMTGVVAAMNLQPPMSRRMLPHEGLVPSILQRQVRLARTTGAQLEPVVAVHRATARWQQVVAAITAAPADVAIVTEDDVAHQVWVCTERSVADVLAAEVVDGESMIADGHHRWAALQGLAASGAPVDALVMLVDVEHGGLQLGAIHRVLRDLTWAAVEAAEAPTGRPLADEAAARGLLDEDPESCVLTDGRRWLAVGGSPDGEPWSNASRTGEHEHRSGLRPDHRLAVSRLHTQWVISWGCAERDIQYVHDLSTATMLARRDGGLAVLLPSLSLDTVFAAARAGVVLPRKATSFGPKPRIGLLMRLLPHS